MDIVWQLTSVPHEHDFEVLLVKLRAVGGSGADRHLPDEDRYKKSLRRER